MRIGNGGKDRLALEEEIAVVDAGSLVEPGVERRPLGEVAGALGDASLEGPVLGDLCTEAEEVAGYASTSEAPVDGDHPQVDRFAWLQTANLGFVLLVDYPRSVNDRRPAREVVRHAGRWRRLEVPVDEHTGQIFWRLLGEGDNREPVGRALRNEPAGELVEFRAVSPTA